MAADVKPHRHGGLLIVLARAVYGSIVQEAAPALAGL